MDGRFGRNATCGVVGDLARLVLVAILVLTARGQGVVAAPKAVRLVVAGDANEPERLAAAVRGARLAARGEDGAAFPGGVEVVEVAVPADAAAQKRALDGIARSDPLGIVALPTPDAMGAWWKASERWGAPTIAVTGLPPDGTTRPQSWFHLGPTPECEAIAAADWMVAPLSARRVAVVHEPTARGVRLAAAFLRNRSPWIASAGAQAWPSDAGPSDVGDLKAREAGWIYAAVSGRYARSFVREIAAGALNTPVLFADGLHEEPFLLEGSLPDGSALLDGPDAELSGGIGANAYDALRRDGVAPTATTIRGFEAARRLIAARKGAGSAKLKRVLEALAPHADVVTSFGMQSFAAHGAVDRWPPTLWRIDGGRHAPWRADRMPTEGCGPPLGFGRPPRPAVGERGRIGYLFYGEAAKRTIEADLTLLGLSTAGAAPAIDAFVREEILARAARIAHRLFRREGDGTPIPGWSWGMAITIAEVDGDVPASRVWPALVAGDHPDAGGQAFGTWVAVYSTFLRRTMYQQHALDPPLSPDDAPLLDGRMRWGEDGGRNRRADEIRCLIDGFASAVGLTLAHEYGHLCGCDHDTEHPTSIMNVVAGAGAGWEDAVWIPRHQQRLTQMLGIDVP